MSVRDLFDNSNRLSSALRRGRRRPHRRLRLESLEDRSLLANLVLGLQPWTNVAGAKGERIPAVDATADPPVYQVEVGQTFWLQVLADDDREGDVDNPDSAGIIALPLDITWNDDDVSRIRYTGELPSPFPDEISPVNSIVTPQFARQRFVDAFDAAADAIALRGASVPALDGTQPIGRAGCDWGAKDDCREFSLMLFTAEQAGEETIHAELIDSMSFADAARLDEAPPVDIVIQIVDVSTNSTSSLSGYAFIDADRDGVRESHELPLPNVEITLSRDGDAGNTITRTGPDGSYRFDNLPAGRYTIRETHPSGFVDGTDYLGWIVSRDAEPVASTGAALQDRLVDIVLGDGEHGIDFNFTEVGISDVDKRNFLASTPPGIVLVCTLLEVNAAYIRATAGDDTIEVFNNGVTITVYVNESVAGTYDTFEHPVVMIDAIGGDDSVTVQGTTASETAQIEPGGVSLWPNDVPLMSGYGVRVVGAEDIQLDPGGGSDVLILRDSSGDDSLELNADSAAIRWDGDQQRATLGPLEADDQLTAISSSGAGDNVLRNAPVYTTELLGVWQPLVAAPAARLMAASDSASISARGTSTATDRSAPSAPASATLRNPAGLDARTIARQLSRWKSS